MPSNYRRFLSVLLVILVASVLSTTAQTKASFVTKETSTDTYATARVIADLNGDGIPDLIEPYARIMVGKLFSVQLGLGNGYFAAPVDYNANINHQYGDTVLTADVNGDGKADVIFITGQDLLVYLGQGDGTLLPPQHYTLSDYAGLAQIGDFNHDGIPDLVLSLNSGVVVELGTGSGAFSAPTTVFTPGPNQGIESLAVGDFDGDANLDIALGVYNGPCNPGLCTTDDVHILYGSGTGTFVDEIVYPGVPGDVLFASGDLNNDGKSDLVTGLYEPENNGNTAVALFGQPSRTVKAQYLNTNGLWVAGPPQAIADFNGDGYNDLAVKMFSLQSNELYIGMLLGGPNNTFKFQDFGFGNEPPDSGYLLVGDFNRDGKPDTLFTASDNTDSNFNVYDYVETGSMGVRTRCEYPGSAAGISYCLYRSGADGATVAFGATANWFEPLRKMELWLDGQKTTEQYNVWDKYAWLMSATETFASGTHRADIYSAGYDNVLQHQTVTFSVPGSTCPPPNSPGLNICSPLNGQTVGREVEALAGGAVSGTIRRMEVWIDGTKMDSTNQSNQLDAILALVPGTHTFTFYVVNTAGKKLSQSVSVTVK